LQGIIDVSLLPKKRVFWKYFFRCVKIYFQAVSREAGEESKDWATDFATIKTLRYESPMLVCS
jgi:hypothetical protein